MTSLSNVDNWLKRVVLWIQSIEFICSFFCSNHFSIFRQLISYFNTFPYQFNDIYYWDILNQYQRHRSSDVFSVNLLIYIVWYLLLSMVLLLLIEKAYSIFKFFSCRYWVYNIVFKSCVLLTINLYSLNTFLYILQQSTRIYIDKSNNKILFFYNIKHL